MNRAKSSRNWTLRIQDILKSIETIAQFLEGVTLAEFRKNRLIIDAVVRNFDIIGEASNHIPKTIQNQYSDIPWRDIVGMRNILIHEYFDMESDVVWYTAKRHLPKLKEQLVSIKHLQE